jgi:hypothetical protein
LRWICRPITSDPAGGRRRLRASQRGERRTVSSLATLNSGATAAQINAAIAACSNGVVYLNAGTCNLTTGIIFSGRDNVTLRGAGPSRR